jgi:peptidoglycan hydrolase-like protein with peptidoglycan-binding domain
MLKTLGFILLVILVIVMFNTPARNFMNNLLHKDKTELREEQIIGRVSGYNPWVEELQRILKDTGFEPGPIDGVMGGQTRAAIRKFQKEKGLKSTGKVDSTTQLALNRVKEITKEAPKIEAEPDLFVEQVAQEELKTEGSKIEASDIKRKSEVQDEIMTYRLKSKDRVKQIQIALKRAGFYRGEVDGKFGSQTKRAIIAFQKLRGLKPDGVVGPKTWEELEKYLQTR